jgi:hypothetical protein
MIVSYLVSRLALSDAKDFISKNFVKLLIISIILIGFPLAVFIIGLILDSSSMLSDSKISVVSKILFLLEKIYLWTLASLIFLLIFGYIYEKSIIYFIARKENDKYRTFLKWAILDTSIIKSIKSFIGYILIVGLYVIMVFGIDSMKSFLALLAAKLVEIFLLLGGPIVTSILSFVLSIIFEIIFEIISLFILFLSSYISKFYFFARVSNPSNWSSLKMAFFSISGKVIKRILKLALYGLIIEIILLVILIILLVPILLIGFVLFGDQINIDSLDSDIDILSSILSYNINIIIFIYIFIELFVAWGVISDLYILDIIKTNSQSVMSQNAEQSN